MTSEHSQQDLFNTMSYAVGSHVRTSVWQDFKKESQKNPDQVFFTNSSESYAWYDQSTSSWKTWQRSLITDWTSFSGSFPKQGTMQNGQLYLQVHWEPVIVEVDGGSLPTPIASKAVEQKVKFKQGGTPLLAALLPTPTASDVEGGVAKDVQFKNGSFFRENKQGVRWGVKLRDAVSMLPTPTAMDTKDDALKHATKLLQGKTHRASGQPIQVSLSDKVMMEMIKEKPELMKIYQDHQMEERPYLPPQEKFVTYLREQTTIKELAAKTTIKKTTIEHWFRKDKAGFSFPSIEDWQVIKPHLKEIQFDKEMTTVQNKEWTTKMDREMLPTPTASEHKARMKDTTQAEKCLSAMARRDELSIQTGENMFLNPCFVEEMMGYEVGWTDLNH